MRIIDVEASKLQIAERDDYSFTLARQYNGATQEMHLYGVLVAAPFRSEKVFVLAESEEGAIGQAQCACGLETYRTAPEVLAQTTFHAERIPLVIRAWGATRF
jgi:hypothetical protein